MFGKFMNKKFFHPGSYPNVKMRWIHEQRDAAKKKVEEEKQSTYQKEQESYQSRMLSAKSTEEKMKLDLNFLYDLPPGMKTEKEKDEDEEEVEVKFEWQKHAPRSKYVNDLGLDCQDQPFGVCVRNIRCFKCKAWGHQNTDRECPLFFSNVNSEAEGNSEGKKSLRLSDPLLLVGAMKEQHGISLKKSVIGQEIDPITDNQQLIPSDEDEEELGNDDLKFVESLTNKQKRRLLKRLNKLENNEHKERKKNKKGTTHKKRKKKNNSSSEEEDKSIQRKIYNKTEIDSSNYEKRKSRIVDLDYRSGQRRQHRKDRYERNIRSKKHELKHCIEENHGECSTYEQEISTYPREYYKNSSGDDDYHDKRKYSRKKYSTDFIDDQPRSVHKERKQHSHDLPYNKHDKKHFDDSEKRSIRKDSKKFESIIVDKRSCRKLTECESYNEIDEKLHQIRKGVHKIREEVES